MSWQNLDIHMNVTSPQYPQAVRTRDSQVVFKKQFEKK